MREKTLVNWWKMSFFLEKTFVECSLVPPNNAMSPNFVEKNFTNSHKTSKFAKVFFSLETFPLYGIYLWSCIIHSNNLQG